MSLLNYKHLNNIASIEKYLYNKNTPYPHIVIDNFLPNKLAKTIHGEFPSKEHLNWWKYNNLFEKKLAFDDISNMPPNIKQLFIEFNSQKFVSYLEKLTGIANLLADPTYRGGGLHQILPGGKLDIHADFNLHPTLNLERRLNVLLYLNEDWKPEWRGELELWDQNMTRCVKAISPVFNRFVCFNVTDDSNHGHPEPLNCPENISRKSLAVYYYTKPTSELKPHSTIYKKRPQDAADEHTETLRKARAKGRL